MSATDNQVASGYLFKRNKKEIVLLLRICPFKNNIAWDWLVIQPLVWEFEDNSKILKICGFQHELIANFFLKIFGQIVFFSKFSSNLLSEQLFVV